MRLIHRARLLGIILALLAFHTSPSAAQEILPPELAVVPHDAAAFFHVRPAELLRPAGLNLNLFPFWTEDLEKSLGHPLSESESITLILPSSARAGDAAPMEYVFVETTVAPLDQTRVLKRWLGEDVIEKKHRDRTYYVPGPSAGRERQGAVYVVNKNTHVFASLPTTMPKLLDNLAGPRTAGPSDAALSLVRQKRHVVLWADMTSPFMEKFRKEFVPSLDQRLDAGTNPAAAPMVDMIKKVMELRSFALAFDLGNEARLDSELVFPSERLAAAAQGPFEDLLNLSRIFGLGALRGLARSRARSMALGNEEVLGPVVFGSEILIPTKRPLAKRDIAPFLIGESLLKQAESGLRKLSVEQQKTKLTVQARVKVDAAGAASEALAEARALVKANEPLRIEQKRTAGLKELILAMHSYHDVYKKFPEAAICDKAGKPLLSWRVEVLPFIGHIELYNQFKRDEPWDSPHNIKLLDQMPAAFNPSGGFEDQKKRHLTVFQVFTGEAAPFKLGRDLRFANITDGASMTIGIVEASEAVPWTKPVDLVYDEKKAVPKLGGVSKDGFYAAFFDGTVRRVPMSVTEASLRALITHQGGEVIGPDAFE